ncbi:hypothetical protein BaRGS_00027940, partial [Batillaria attramentaria]
TTLNKSPSSVMRLSLSVIFCRWRRLVPVLILLLVVSALLVKYSDVSMATDPSSHSSDRHRPNSLPWIGLSEHVDSHVREDSVKFKVESTLNHTHSDRGTSGFYGNNGEGKSTGSSDSATSVPLSKVKKNSSSDRKQVIYQEYNSADNDDEGIDEVTYRDEKFQVVENGYIAADQSGTRGSSGARLNQWNGFLKANVKYMSTGDIDASDVLFPPCEGPNIPEVKPNPSFGFLGPFRYLANYKNPCWMEPPVVHCVPYFYVVGAPKAGSTDLFKRITQHPEVVSPTAKETRWFDRARTLERGTNYHRLVTGECERVEGDGSPSYFFDNRNWSLIPGNERCTEPRVTVASHIHHLYPKAKIIFILRNPVDRLYSSYLYNHAKYGPVSSQTFDMYVREAIKVYNDCFARFSMRHCANNATVFGQAKVMLIVSLYSVFVQDWLTLFPREQILVVTTEKYNAYMEENLKKIFEFLELGPLSAIHLQRIAQHGPYNKGQHYSKAGPMLPSTRALLEDFYRPYNQQLAHLLNNPDFLWM